MNKNHFPEKVKYSEIRQKMPSAKKLGKIVRRLLLALFFQVKSFQTLQGNNYLRVFVLDPLNQIFGCIKKGQTLCLLCELTSLINDNCSIKLRLSHAFWLVLAKRSTNQRACNETSVIVQSSVKSCKTFFTAIKMWLSL